MMALQLFFEIECDNFQVGENVIVGSSGLGDICPNCYCWTISFVTPGQNRVRTLSASTPGK